MPPSRLTPTEVTERRGGSLYVLCRCRCGTEKLIRADHVRTGRIKSCGCWRRARGQAWGRSQTLHGDATAVEYIAWRNMLNRCFNSKHAGYKNYGGRGITVCQRWRTSYPNFLADMGRRPAPGYSIDRRNNDGNYTPSNCRWATRAEQMANRRPYRKRAS